MLTERDDKYLEKNNSKATTYSATRRHSACVATNVAQSRWLEEVFFVWFFDLQKAFFIPSYDVKSSSSCMGKPYVRCLTDA
jgi:hypothetical protein